MLRNLARLAACALAVVTFAACADDPQAPFAVEGSGTIAGRVFFDADNNGRFTPIGGDTALAGLTVQLRERASGDIIATTTSGADGSFSFADVPAGTHDVFVVNSTGNLTFCVNPARASVFLGEQAFVSVTGKRGCVVTIEAAEKQAQGSPVTVAGVVTVRQGTFRGDNTYIQDNTGGIQVFGLVPLNLQEGDSIEVSGTLGLFSTEIQIINPQVAPNIKRVPLIVPKQVTAAAIAALIPTSPDVGRLVVVRRATVGTTFTSGNSTITDASGSAIFRLDGAVASAIPTAMFATAGKCYDVTGVVGIFANAGQLKPRKLADVVEVPCAL